MFIKVHIFQKDSRFTTHSVSVGDPFIDTLLSIIQKLQKRSQTQYTEKYLLFYKDDFNQLVQITKERYEETINDIFNIHQQQLDLIISANQNFVYLEYLTQNVQTARLAQKAQLNPVNIQGVVENTELPNQQAFYKYNFEDFLMFYQDNKQKLNQIDCEFDMMKEINNELHYLNYKCLLQLIIDETQTLCCCLFKNLFVLVLTKIENKQLLIEQTLPIMLSCSCQIIDKNIIIKTEFGQIQIPIAEDYIQKIDQVQLFVAFFMQLNSVKSVNGQFFALQQFYYDDMFLCKQFENTLHIVNNYDKVYAPRDQYFISENEVEQKPQNILLSEVQTGNLLNSFDIYNSQRAFYNMEIAKNNQLLYFYDYLQKENRIILFTQQQAIFEQFILLNFDQQQLNLLNISKFDIFAFVDEFRQSLLVCLSDQFKQTQISDFCEFLISNQQKQYTNQSMIGMVTNAACIVLFLKQSLIMFLQQYNSIGKFTQIQVQQLMQFINVSYQLINGYTNLVNNVNQVDKYDNLDPMNQKLVQMFVQLNNIILKSAMQVYSFYYQMMKIGRQDNRDFSKKKSIRGLIFQIISKDTRQSDEVCLSFKSIYFKFFLEQINRNENVEIIYMLLNGPISNTQQNFFELVFNRDFKQITQNLKQVTDKLQLRLFPEFLLKKEKDQQYLQFFYYEYNIRANNQSKTSNKLIKRIINLNQFINFQNNQQLIVVNYFPFIDADIIDDMLIIDEDMCFQHNILCKNVNINELVNEQFLQGIHQQVYQFQNQHSIDLMPDSNKFIKNIDIRKQLCAIKGNKAVFDYIPLQISSNTYGYFVRQNVNVKKHYTIKIGLFLQYCPQFTYAILLLDEWKCTFGMKSFSQLFRQKANQFLDVMDNIKFSEKQQYVNKKYLQLNTLSNKAYIQVMSNIYQHYPYNQIFLYVHNLYWDLQQLDRDIKQKLFLNNIIMGRFLKLFQPKNIRQLQFQLHQNLKYNIKFQSFMNQNLEIQQYIEHSQQNLLPEKHQAAIYCFCQILGQTFGEIYMKENNIDMKHKIVTIENKSRKVVDLSIVKQINQHNKLLEKLNEQLVVNENKRLQQLESLQQNMKEEFELLKNDVIINDEFVDNVFNYQLPYFTSSQLILSQFTNLCCIQLNLYNSIESLKLVKSSQPLNVFNQIEKQFDIIQNYIILQDGVINIEFYQKQNVNFDFFIKNLQNIEKNDFSYQQLTNLFQNIIQLLNNQEVKIFEYHNQFSVCDNFKNLQNQKQNQKSPNYDPAKLQLFNESLISKVQFYQQVNQHIFILLLLCQYQQLSTSVKIMITEQFNTLILQIQLLDEDNQYMKNMIHQLLNIILIYNNHLLINIDKAIIQFFNQIIFSNNQLKFEDQQVIIQINQLPEQKFHTQALVYLFNELQKQRQLNYLTLYNLSQLQLLIMLFTNKDEPLQASTQNQTELELSNNQLSDEQSSPNKSKSKQKPKKSTNMKDFQNNTNIANVVKPNKLNIVIYLLSPSKDGNQISEENICSVVQQLILQNLVNEITIIKLLNNNEQLNVETIKQLQEITNKYENVSII